MKVSPDDIASRLGANLVLGTVRFATGLTRCYQGSLVYRASTGAARVVTQRNPV